ncbi:DUF2254 domain-containing protein [Neolewinella sp.]|uniref:DUF2254 domain-containing protein n=1 Tax=Neolewinella sp. TaxID=2993543 RepID=UPI003B51F511
MGKIMLLLRDLVRSIASLPTLIFFAFVALACYQLSTTDEAQDLPDWLAPYNLTDLDTIRTTLAAVITGVFTLTIFAYTMVMNVLDRSISSYSPRLLPLVLSERYHQEILGVGAGTIAHSTILLLGVAEPPEFSKPPVLAAASAGFFAILSLVLFIYFIHRVSQSIFINVLLRKSYDYTRRRLERLDEQRLSLITARDRPDDDPQPRIFADRCGYLDELDYAGLVDAAQKLRTEIYLLPRPGSFVYTGDPLFGWGDTQSADQISIDSYYTLSREEPIDVYATGFKHQVEVAIKAASPAINDPGTAMTAINYLGQLFMQLAAVKPYNAVTGQQDAGVLRLNDWQVGTLLDSCFTQLRCYLDSDPWGVDTMRENLLRIEQACVKYDHPTGASAARRQLQQLVSKP